jgi:hypothetical protein
VTPHAAACQYKYGTIKKEKEKETSKNTTRSRLKRAKKSK